MNITGYLYSRVGDQLTATNSPALTVWGDENLFKVKIFDTDITYNWVVNSTADRVWKNQTVVFDASKTWTGEKIHNTFTF